MANLGLQNNNPGNLRDPKTGSFQVFNSPEEGHQALINDIKIKQSGQSSHIKPGASLEDFANVWAPTSDKNDPKNYAKVLGTQLKVDPAQPFDTIPPEKLAEAIKVAEGTNSMKTGDTQDSNSVGQLSHEQLIGNINAMEQQGAKPEEIQGYLDSLKTSTSQQSTDGYQTTAAPLPKDEIKNPDTTQEQSLGSQLNNRVQEGTQAIGSIVGGKKATGQTRASGLLQTVGAVAGGLGDVVNKGLELIPGVKQVENLIGQGVGSLAKTGGGQAVMKSVQDFSTAHPELAKDIGAGFNIVTAIPILKGLGVVGKLGMEAGSQALKETVIKGFAKDLETSGGKAAQKLFTPEVVDTSIKLGVAPEIKSVGGKTITDTTLAQKNLEKEVSRIENEVYQPKLEGLDLKFPMEGVKNLANDISVENLSDPSAVAKILDRVSAKYGDTPTLAQLNQAKRDITKKISSSGFADPDLSNNRIARMALQQAIEKGGLQFGLGDLGAINEEMGNILKTLNFYGKMDGMSVKQGLLHQGIKAISTATGAGLGGMLGNPIAGGALGYGASDLIEGQLGKLAPRSVRAGIIKRTGANATKVSREEMLKKLPGLFAGAVNVK